MKRLFTGALVCALLLAALFTGIARADRITAMQPQERCVYKARLVTLVAGKMIIENQHEIRFYFATEPEQSEKDWLQDIVEEVDAQVRGGAQNPIALGQAAFDRCMSEKSVLAAPGYFLAAASSESLAGPPIGSRQWCMDRAFDIRKIGEFVSDGAPKEEVKAFAMRSAELGPERLKDILEMIDEAYAHEGPFVEWMKSRFRDCMPAS